MTMTPTVNNTDVYVPIISCFPGDDAADVVTPPVSAAPSAPVEVSCPPMPDDAPVVLLASGLGVAVELALLVLDVFTDLLAKPGDDLVLNHMCLVTASDS